METELKELIAKFESIFKTERKIEPIFLIVALALKTIFKIPLPNGIFILIFALFLLTFPSSYFLRKQKNIKRAEFICFAYWFVNITLIALIAYYLGNIWWIGLGIIIFPVVHSNILLPRLKGLILAFYASAWYAGLALLEYFGIIPHQSFFTLSSALYRNPYYILVTLITGSVVVFPYVAYITSGNAGMLRKKTKELIKTYKELEEAKAVLEIKVEARTKELKELAEKREEIIKERTRELQKKVKELEKFHKFAVGREIKMVELKKEISKLKKDSKKSKID